MIDTTHCSEYFQSVLTEAKALGPKALESLQDRLEYLGTWACMRDGVLDPERTRCVLYKDFALLSFGFEILQRNEAGEYTVHMMNGGLIFHGDKDRRWGVHT
jgi:hypothetical protein